MGERPLRLAVLTPARDEAAGTTSTIGGLLPELWKLPLYGSLARSGPHTDWEPTERS